MYPVKYFKQVLLGKIFRPRTYVLLVLLGFVTYLYVKPVVAFSQEVHYKAAPWAFPFIVSNIYFIFLFMLGIVYYFSDVPFMQYYNMYQVIRTGRRNWAIVQIAAIMGQSFFIMGFGFLASVLCLGGHCELTLGWGKLLHTSALTNAAEHYGFLFSVPYEAMQRFEPLELAALTICIGSLVICFVGLLMFAASLVFNRNVAVFLAAAMAAAVYFVENIHPLIAQKVSMFVPVSWMRTTNIATKVHGSYVVPPVGYMLTALAVGILVLCMIILWKVKRVEFQWNKEG